MMQIPCQGRGVTIYTYGAGTLAVEVDRRPRIVAKLMGIEGLKLHQDRDNEQTFLFQVSLFEQVAEVVKPRKRRRLTPTQRQALAKHAFSCRDGAQKATLERAQTAQGDLLAAQAQVGTLF
jgi:hypothetical protein